LTSKPLANPHHVVGVIAQGDPPPLIDDFQEDKDRAEDYRLCSQLVFETNGSRPGTYRGICSGNLLEGGICVPPGGRAENEDDERATDQAEIRWNWLRGCQEHSRPMPWIQLRLGVPSVEFFGQLTAFLE